MYITVKQLKKWYACSEDVRAFRRLFGTRAKINATNIEKALKAGLAVYWLLAQITPGQHWKKIIDFRDGLHSSMGGHVWFTEATAITLLTIAAELDEKGS